MPRETSRKLGVDPNMVHAEVARDFAGSIQMDTANAHTGNFAAVTATDAGVVTVDDLVAATTAKVNVTATTGTPTVNLTRGGSTIATQTGTGTASNTKAVHTSVLNAPSFGVKVAGGQATGTVTVTREKRL